MDQPPTTRGDPPVPGTTHSGLEDSAPAPEYVDRFLGGDPGAGEPLISLPDYEILGELGRGGMGIVYKARHRPLDRVVALKVIRADRTTEPEYVARFLNEARAAARVAHPNIVQVHAVGEHQGRPYLALEYVAGPTLERACGRAPQPADQAARVAEALARGVQAAHEKGVVHRDLKPANVLLQGPTNEGPAIREGATAAGALPDARALAGVPKVTDFGLARRLEATAQTQTGAILGTPAYMAPEQARGRGETGPACDVWALGAILYEMLTGRPPFQGATPLETLQQVLEADPPPPSGLEPRLPRDIEIITLKCLQKEASQRYPSALDLADDLRRYLAGEPIRARPVGLWRRAGKWARRRPVHATLLAGGLLAAAALAAGGVWHNARLSRALKDTQEQRDAARANLDLALDTVTKLLGEVGSERLKDIPEMAPVREALLEKALAFCQEIVRRSGDDAQARKQTGVAYQRVGEIYIHLGRLADAEEAFRQATAMHRRLAEEFPEEPGHRNNYSNGLIKLGEVYYHQKRHARALECTQEGIDLPGLPAGESAAAPADEACLAKAYSNLGVYYFGTGKHDLALQAYAKAAAKWADLAAREPTNTTYKRSLAGVRNNVGQVYMTVGRLKEAEEALLESVAVMKGLGGDRPAPADDLEHVARSYWNLRHVYQRAGKPDRELAASRESLKAFAELSRRHPNVPRYQVELAYAHMTVGQVLGSHRDKESAGKALEAYEQARKLLEPLRLVSGEDPYYRGALANVYHGLGWRHFSNRDFARAKTFYDKAAPLREEAVRRSPDTVEDKRLVAQLYHELGMLHTNLKQPAESGAAYQKALAIRTELVGKHPDMPAFLDGLAWTLNNLASNSEERGRVAEALKGRMEALAIRARLAARYATIPNLRELADAHWRVGEVHNRAGAKDEAERCYREWVRLRDDLARKHPGDVRLALEAGAGHKNLADYLLAFGKPKEALASCARARGWLDPLWKKAPKDASVRAYTRQNHGAEARTLARLGRFREAQAAWERALPLADDKTRGVIRLGRAIAVACQGGHARAAREAEEVAARRGSDGSTCFWVAATFAACLSAAERDEKRPPGEREALAAKYAARAVAMLRQARKAGYFAAAAARAEFDTNEYLKSLRSRPEFKGFGEELGR
jgi:tetratricopeptide (TPR) repeat protein